MSVIIVQKRAVVILAFALLAFASHLIAEEQGPFVIETASGNCETCDNIYTIGKLQFVAPDEAWASGSHFASPEGQGTGTTTLLHTVDGGITWKQIAFVVQSVAEAGTEFDFIDRHRGWITWMGQDGESHVMRTTDAGLHWQELTHSSLEYIKFFNSRFGYAIKFNGLGVRRSFVATTNGGKTWSKVRHLSLDSFPQAMFFADRKNGWITGTTKGNKVTILRTTNGGRVWHKKDIAFGSPQDLFFLDRQTGWLTIRDRVNSSSSLFKTTDGGKHWSPVSCLGLEGRAKYVTLVRFFNQTAGFISFREGVSNKNYLAFTTDNGQNWTELENEHLLRYCQVFRGEMRCSAGGLDVVRVRMRDGDHVRSFGN
jgi:photosystem II stability/assembly factor-like uncharacterized protein